MPLLVGAHILLALFCALHVVRNQRSALWLPALAFFPLLGSAAYILMVMAPAGKAGPVGRRRFDQAQAETRRASDTRGAFSVVEADRTPANIRRAADAMLEVNRNSEALKLYQEVNEGLFRADPELMTGLARAQFANDQAEAALETLNELRRLHPDSQLADAHHLYARALAATGCSDEAAAEFEAAAAYAPGVEIHAHYALFMEEERQFDIANAAWKTVLDKSENLSDLDRRAAKKWINMARARLQ